ncbi:MAG: branched-chain amino acid aminotransferase [Planctomycetota bacterium]
MIPIEPIPPEKLKPVPISTKNIVFGSVFTDRMFQATYKNGAWQDYKIVPFGPISLSPAAVVLHYSQEIFEGMKAYRSKDQVYLFRPEMNAKRLNASAPRMCMPEFPEADFIEALKTLIKQEQRWVPNEGKGPALYIRPMMIGTEPSIKVKSSSEFLFLIILSPVGSYFKSDFTSVKIYVEEKYHRACAGGTGAAKTGGNYAASLLPTKFVTEKFDCQQILWLDAKENAIIEEVGAMNIFFVEEGKRLVTPLLSGSILAGVTRDSLLKLGPHLGYEAVERKLRIQEIMDGIKSGYITEIFGCGTAAVIASVGTFIYKDQQVQVGSGESGPVAKKLFEELTNIQYGLGPDPFKWRVPV